MKINIDRDTLKAVVVAAVVGAILISGLDIKLNLSGESIMQSIGFAASLVFVFVLVRGRGGSDDN